MVPKADWFLFIVNVAALSVITIFPFKVLAPLIVVAPPV
jgi:hypothetical protein